MTAHYNDLLAEASDPNTSSDRLSELLRLEVDLVGQAAPSTIANIAALQKLRQQVAQNPNATPADLLVLAQECANEVLQNPVLPFLTIEDPFFLHKIPVNAVLLASLQADAPSCLYPYLLGYLDQKNIAGYSIWHFIGWILKQHSEAPASAQAAAMQRVTAIIEQNNHLCNAVKIKSLVFLCQHQLPRPLRRLIKNKIHQVISFWVMRGQQLVNAEVFEYQDLHSERYLRLRYSTQSYVNGTRTTCLDLASIQGLNIKFLWLLADINSIGIDEILIFNKSTPAALRLKLFRKNLDNEPFTCRVLSKWKDAPIDALFLVLDAYSPFVLRNYYPHLLRLIFAHRAATVALRWQLLAVHWSDSDFVIFCLNHWPALPSAWLHMLAKINCPGVAMALLSRSAMKETFFNDLVKKYRHDGAFMSKYLDIVQNLPIDVFLMLADTHSLPVMELLIWHVKRDKRLHDMLNSELGEVAAKNLLNGIAERSHQQDQYIAALFKDFQA
jgi:hypothetical protein